MLRPSDVAGHFLEDLVLMGMFLGNRWLHYCALLQPGEPRLWVAMWCDCEHREPLVPTIHAGTEHEDQQRLEGGFHPEEHARLQDGQLQAETVRGDLERRTR